MPTARPTNRAGLDHGGRLRCSGPSAPSPKRVTLRTLRDKYRRGEPISMVTAYDYPSAVHVSAGGGVGMGKPACLPAYLQVPG